MIRSVFAPCLTALSLMAAVATPALAQEPRAGFYAKIYGGLSLQLEDEIKSGGVDQSVDFDSGIVTGAAIGYTYPGSNFASEIEYIYRSSDASGFDAAFATGGDLASTAVMVNGYYRFASVLKGRLRPYVGAGLGYATEIDIDLDIGGVENEYEDDGFAFQLMGGMEYALSDRWAINGEVRYFDAGSADLEGQGGSVKVDYRSIDLLAGVAFRF